MSATRSCSISECPFPAHRKGFCSSHYGRWRKHGDPLAGRTRRGALREYLVGTVFPYDGENCLIWPFGRLWDGYGEIYLDGKMHRVSRVVCERVHGPPPSPVHEAAHSCGKGHEGCVAPGHLSWKTPLQNAEDKIVHGTVNAGQRNGQAKLTLEDVRRVRTLINVLSIAAIARQFGVTASTIRRIEKRQAWKDAA